MAEQRAETERQRAEMERQRAGVPGVVALGKVVGLVTTFTSTAPLILEPAGRGLVNDGRLHAAIGTEVLGKKNRPLSASAVLVKVGVGVVGLLVELEASAMPFPAAKVSETKVVLAGTRSQSFTKDIFTAWDE